MSFQCFDHFVLHVEGESSPRAEVGIVGIQGVQGFGFDFGFRFDLVWSRSRHPKEKF